MARKNLTRSQFAMHEERAVKIEHALVSRMKASKAKRVAVLMSAGVDSHACLFAALRAGKDVTCYSFTLDDRKSTDYKIAERTACTFGLPFVGIQLSTQLDDMKAYMLDLHATYNLSEIHINKTSVECLWPMFNALTQIVQDKQQATVCGFGGDAFFCTIRSQKKRLHEYELVKQEYFDNVVRDECNVQGIMIANWLKLHAPRHEFISPFHTQQMFDAFKGMHPFDPGCKPIQKAPIRLAFWKEFQQTDVRVHQSFQKGDSGISDHFEKLLITSDWNTRGLKSVKGIYNDLEAGLLK